MNNEPVAWITEWKFKGEDCREVTFYEGMRGNSAKSIPLYTHPVKELPNNHQYIAQLEMTVRNQQAEIEALKEKLNEAIDAEKDRRFE